MREAQIGIVFGQPRENAIFADARSEFPHCSFPWGQERAISWAPAPKYRRAIGYGTLILLIVKRRQCTTSHNCPLVSLNGAWSKTAGGVAGTTLVHHPVWYGEFRSVRSTAPIVEDEFRVCLQIALVLHVSNRESASLLQPPHTSHWEPW
jgi:hypothetical protein